MCKLFPHLLETIPCSTSSRKKPKELIKKYKDKLKKYRTCGLEKNGEYSDENLVFKVLRRNGYIEKLYDFENEIIDKKYSLSEEYPVANDTFSNVNFKDRAVGNSVPSQD